ncbi:ATP-dependent RNA helicase Ddx1-like [Topomyia yanbarensis]|uniref:ATP-dependent RNA helicase Ddx1-like n=1 Tax=Topomyia yanbarensis TaxID=2498891 RepID=UPI00273BCE12|nr:ATP-dependent RNA helicase Ddx1-like [Topomyia yanbarensis]
MAAFEEFGVMPEISQAIDEMEWMLPTDVQAEAIPLILGGGDVLMAAETGSGKTGAFCLPILQIVWERLRDVRDGKAGTIGHKVKPWTLSYTDRDNAMAVTPDGLRCQSREFKEWHGCRCTTGVRGKGKYYYEATVADDGLCRVGWSTEKANLALGTDKFGFGFGGTGKKSNCQQFDSYGDAFGKMDVIGCLLDLDKGEISYTKNGKALGLAFRITDSNLRNAKFFPAVVVKNSEMAFNFGETDFKYPVPEGFIAVCNVSHDHLALNPNTGSAAATEDQPKPNAPQALIIEPSRELAEQTFDQIQKFKKHLKDPNVRELLLIGGVRIQDQLETLQSGVDIIVATPGRLEDLINNGYVLLSSCRFFVLDEADGLLNNGYTELIERLHKQIPKINADGCRLQMVVCSATLHSFEVKKLAEKLMHFPTWIDLRGEDAVPETVHHVVCYVDPQKDTSWWAQRKHITTDGVHAKDNVRPGSNTAETLSEAVKILKGEYTVNAINEHNMDRALIFCRTKLDCDNMERYLRQIDPVKYSCVCLHGDRRPQERKGNLEKFKNKQVKFLICTDVAARGLDISGLPFLINVTLPDEKSMYVHRIGRVGRAERMGLAISLAATVPEKVWYHGPWCSSRGKNCWNTNLTNVKGCCMWYDEKMYLVEIEEHLKVTLQQIDKDLKVPMNEFDGKVTYGEKQLNTASNYKDHVEQLTPIVQKLAQLEREAQNWFLKRGLVASSQGTADFINDDETSTVAVKENSDGISATELNEKVKEPPKNKPAERVTTSTLNRSATSDRFQELNEKVKEPPKNKPAERVTTSTLNRSATSDRFQELNEKVKEPPKNKPAERVTTSTLNRSATSDRSQTPQKKQKVKNGVAKPMQSIHNQSDPGDNSKVRGVIVKIIPKSYPNRQLSTEEASQIRKRVLALLVEQRASNNVKPVFTQYATLTSGCMVFYCAGEGTAKWLEGQAYWNTVDCITERDSGSPKKFKALGYFKKSAEETTEFILGMIEAQNKLSTSGWRTLQRRNTGTMAALVFEIDAISWEKLKRRKFWINFSYGLKVKLKNLTKNDQHASRKSIKK